MHPAIRRPTYPRVLACAAVPFVILAATARPVAAQAAAHAESRRAIVSAPAITRAVATYRLNAPGLAGFPQFVTVADSAGVIVASYRADGGAIALPLVVTVLYTDLVLQADTHAGLLTLVLEGQNSGATPAVSGRWSLGAEQGVLRARVTQ